MGNAEHLFRVVDDKHPPPRFLAVFEDGDDDTVDAAALPPSLADVLR